MADYEPGNERRDRMRKFTVRSYGRITSKDDGSVLLPRMAAANIGEENVRLVTCEIIVKPFFFVPTDRSPESTCTLTGALGMWP